MPYAAGESAPIINLQLWSDEVCAPDVPGEGVDGGLWRAMAEYDGAGAVKLEIAPLWLF